MLLLDSQVLIYHKATDMRKSIDGLSSLVSQEFGLNPTNSMIFVFFNRQKDKLKLLYWHINGFCVFYKRLERQRFKLPLKFDSSIQVSTQELRWLLDGLEFSKLTGHKKINYEVFC